MKRILLVAGIVLMSGFSMIPANAARRVEIEYWQYVYAARVNAMEQLIKKFEAAHPGITVKQVTFPYADYRTRIVAASMAGKGPDVMQLFYGWLDKFIAGNLLRPLSQETFPNEQIESEFFPIITAMKRDGKYYGLPTAVRSLALFYNKKLFEENGLDPNHPPQTLDELVAVGKAIAKFDDAGNILTEGLALDINGQDHHWWRETLVRQFGGVPYTNGHTKVAYDSPEGIKALAFYTDLELKDKIVKSGFMDEGQAAFRAGRAGMNINGTFRISSFNHIKDFEWGVTELPANADGERSNYSSYFANGIGRKVTGEKLKAAEKFLAYLTSPEAMNIWLDVVGELPAKHDVALTQDNISNPIYGPFLNGLEYAHTTLFVDEAAQRQVAVDMVNRVLLKGQSPAKSIAKAARQEQAIIDEAM